MDNLFKVVISLARGSKCSAVQQIKMTAHISQRGAYVDNDEYRRTSWEQYVKTNKRALQDFFDWLIIILVFFGRNIIKLNDYIDWLIVFCHFIIIMLLPLFPCNHFHKCCLMSFSKLLVGLIVDSSFISSRYIALFVVLLCLVVWHTHIVRHIL